jgi:hypothetical protein
LFFFFFRLILPVQPHGDRSVCAVSGLGPARQQLGRWICKGNSSSKLKATLVWMSVVVSSGGACNCDGSCKDNNERRRSIFTMGDLDKYLFFDFVINFIRSLLFSRTATGWVS